MRVLIVGGVAGGASTAARLRRLSEDVEIIMFERGKEISYANCGMPYHIGKVIKERDSLELITEEDFEKQFNVDVRTQTEVLSIDRKNKTVQIKDLLNNNIYAEKYDYLVLSPGGSPVRPHLSGINDSRIYTIRNLHDMDLIKKYIAEKNPKKAVVVGAGFIGLEVAENLTHLGMQVSIVELADQVMNLLDYEMATAIHQQLHSKNVELFLKDGVDQFISKDKNLIVQLKSGREINTELVILSIGIKPEIQLAKATGLQIGKLGGISVSENMLTSDQNIFALGDVIEIKDIVSNDPALIPLANSANKQGRLVAENIMGANKKYKGTPATAIAKVFDISVATTGNSEKQLRHRNIDYSKVYLHPSSHAGYYPNAFPMVMKLIYQEPSGQILGAQIIGIEGVDKRIDVISAMIQLRKTVYDLAELELAYAPPYSSAKDPVNLAAMIAINQLEGKNKVIFWNELKDLQQKGAILIDVRNKLEFELNALPGSINIPLKHIRERVNEIPKDKPVILICNQGKNAYFAFSILKNIGYQNIYNLSGGLKLYKYTIEKQENVGIFADTYINKKDDLNNIVKTEGSMINIDACGLQCPGPIIKLSEAVKKVKNGDVIEISVTDPGFKNDIEMWCKKTGAQLLSIEDSNKKITARIQIGTKKIELNTTDEIPHDKTIVVFSNDLDRALAAFVIANGAATMNRKVTMFFTFWGLNILRKKELVKVNKGMIDKMFGLMMPKGTSELTLSKMNMLGMGSALMKKVMKNKNVDSLEKMVKEALNSGVRMVACQMSMDIMGIKKEELIDGVEIGGVATYLGSAEEADTNLFI